MSLAAQVAAFRDKGMGIFDDTIRLTIDGVGERVIEISPIGDPTLWVRAPAHAYKPGTFVSNWFYSVDAHSTEAHAAENIRQVNGLDRMPEHLRGHRHFIQNSLIYAEPLDRGHSTQAPVGIMAVVEPEMPDIANRAARQAAG